jgi:predicted transcriptional regulator
MSTRTIEIDERTAEALKARANESGVSIGTVIADLVAAAEVAVPVDEAEIAELDRQWRAIEQGEPTVPHAEVSDWLKTWGTPAFKPRREK